MPQYHQLELGEELFEIFYSPRTDQLDVHCQPKGRSWKCFEMVCADGQGEIYDEKGSSGRAKRIRAALSHMQDSELPIEVRRALQNIHL